MSHPKHEQHLRAAGPQTAPAPVGGPVQAAGRAVGRDRPHLPHGRQRALLLRLSDSEFADTARAAREAGLTPSGYAAEAALAAARGSEPPSGEPLRVVLAELITARLELARLTRGPLAATAPVDSPWDGDPDRVAVVRAVAGVDEAAAAVTRALR